MTAKRSDDAERIIAFPDRRAQLVDVERVFQRERQRLLQFLRLRLGSESEAQDAAQSVFLRLWQRRDTLHGENLSSLLFVAARNVAVDILRQRTSVNGLISTRDDIWHEAVIVRDPDAGAERALLAKQDVALILDLIEQLPPKCRAAFINYHFDQLSYAEIAERMNITQSMVRKHVLRAVAYCVARFRRRDGE